MKITYQMKKDFYIILQHGQECGRNERAHTLTVNWPTSIKTFNVCALWPSNLSCRMFAYTQKYMFNEPRHWPECGEAGTFTSCQWKCKLVITFMKKKLAIGTRHILKVLHILWPRNSTCGNSPLRNHHEYACRAWHKGAKRAKPETG